jgi:hypothetical protein
VTPYSTLCGIVTSPERERLIFLKRIFDRYEFPPFWLYWDPRSNTWPACFGLALIVISGLGLHYSGIFPWWLHLACLLSYLSINVIGVLAFDWCWARWLVKCRASSKCYHDYLTALARRYKLDSRP